MILIKKASSKIDKTIKYVFSLGTNIKNSKLEFSYIDNNTGKDIICVPCQTMCSMSCKFCHLTEHIGHIATNNIHSSLIIDGINYIVDDLKLKANNRLLLISYMGAGEPMTNIDNVLDSMKDLMNKFDNIRFGLATMLPKSKWFEFFKMTKVVQEYKIPLKIHLSLHFTDDKTRLEWMPCALDIKSSINALELYQNLTHNSTEIHYALMDGINNDVYGSINVLNNLIPTNIIIKLMRYSPKENLDIKNADMKNVTEIIEHLSFLNPDRKIEYYEPPGIDVGSSCGMFLMEDILNETENQKMDAVQNK